MKQLYVRLSVILLLSTALTGLLFIGSMYERSIKAGGNYLEQMLSGVEANLESVRKDHEEKIWLLEEDYRNRAWPVEYILASAPQMISESELAIVKDLMEVQGITVTGRDGRICLAVGERSGPEDVNGKVWPDGSRVVVEETGFDEAPSYFYTEVKSQSPWFASVRIDAQADRLGLCSQEEMIQDTLQQATTGTETILAAIEKKKGYLIGITKNNTQDLQVSGIETTEELLEFLEEISREGLRVLEINGTYHIAVAQEQEGAYLLACTGMDQILASGARTAAEGLAGIGIISLVTVLVIHFHLKKHLFCQMGQMKREIQSILAGGQPVSDETGNTCHLPELNPLAETVRRLGRDYMEKREGMIRMEDQLTEARTEARFDQLTGLYNRSGFERCTEEFLNRENPCGVLVLFDLDNFKKINDSEGHPEGDRILVRFGECLRSCFRKSDYIGRLGGDEFTVLMPNPVERGMLEQKFRDLLTQIHSALGIYYERDRVSVSIGAVPVDGEIKSYEGLYRCADTALYIAKYLGKDQFYINDKKISCMKKECIGCRQDCPRSRILKQKK